MADKLPFGGSPNNTPNRPKRMLYTRETWTLPVGGNSLTDLEYAFRVGKITEKEYKRLRRRECAAINPAKRKAVVAAPKAR